MRFCELPKVVVFLGRMGFYGGGVRNEGSGMGCPIHLSAARPGLAGAKASCLYVRRRPESQKGRTYERKEGKERKKGKKERKKERKEGRNKERHKERKKESHE